MKASAFFGHAIPAAVLTLLSAGATSQPLPHTSLNKASSGRTPTLGTAPAKRPASVDATCAANGLCLIVTLALADPANPNLCGTATDLPVDIGDQVNVCYTVTNNSPTTLNYQSLSDDKAGQLLTNNSVTIAAGASYQYNRTITATTNPNTDKGTFTSTWTATDILPGYAANAAAPYNFIDISANGTSLNLSDDGAQSFTMPFSFSFYGTSSNTLCMGNNGGIYFGLAGCSAFPYSNTALPSANLTSPAILPYWLDIMAGGNAYYATVGTAPNRQFMVEWLNKPAFGDSGDPTGQTGATFEVIFNEADGTIDFEYQTSTFGGAAANYDNGAFATVGLQSTATFANQYSYNTASLHNGLAIAWTPITATTYTATAVASLDVGSSGLFTTPNAATGVAPTVPAGGTTSTPLLIDNVGTRNLDWSFQPPAANAHFPKTPRAVVPFQSSGQTQSAFGPRPLLKPGKQRAPMPFAGNAVPVYGWGLSGSGNNYSSFDANTPGTFNTILANDSITLFGATFVNDDFSKEYGVDFYTGNLYVVSTVDGSATLIGNTGLFTCCNVNPGGMRWDATTGTTYLVITDSPHNVSTLYTIDLATAATTLVGTMAPGIRIRDIAIDHSGLMYGIDDNNSALVAIDKTSAATKAIGSVGFQTVYGAGLDFDAETGTLYLSSADESNARMYTVDPVTGLATLIGQQALEVSSIAIAKPGVQCSTPAQAPWLGYNVAGGSVTPDPDQTHPATVILSVDATQLVPGSYSANLCIYSNDPMQSRVPIPVNLTVNAADDIFKDGFDGTP